MTTELVLLLGLFAFILMGVFLGPTGPKNVFFEAAPRLGARVEKHLTTGQGFNFTGGQPIQWEVLSRPAPDGSLGGQ